MIFILFSFITTAFANTDMSYKNINDSHLRFQFMPYTSGPNLTCTHKSIDSGYGADWLVTCDENRSYEVRVVLRQQTRSTNPKHTIQMQYWISERTLGSETVNAGSTIWFHFKDLTETNKIEISQAVEKETASLYLTLSL